MPPKLSAHAFKQGIWSMEMPRTWAFNPANLARSASYDGIWPVHIGVQARGKNASTTFLPRRSVKVTFLSRWLGRVKLGAGLPTRNFILTSNKPKPLWFQGEKDSKGTSIAKFTINLNLTMMLIDHLFSYGQA